jgi:hypothetical protein
MAANEYKGAKYIYSFVMALVGNGRSPECFLNFVEAADRDTENVFLKSSLMEITQGLKGKKGAAKPKVSFPALKYEAASLKGVKVDFGAYASYPPLLIVDDDFETSPTVEAIHAKVQGAVVEPLSSWTEEITNASKVKVNKGEADGAGAFDGKVVAQALAGLAAQVPRTQNRPLQVVADESGVFTQDFPTQ